MRPSLRLLSVLPPSIHSLLAKVPTQDTSVKVQGWLKSVRAHKNVAFASIDDGSGSTLQAVFKRPQNIDLLTTGTSVSLQGRLVQSRGSGQNIELLVDESTILGASDPATYPIQKKHLPEHVLRHHAHLRFRTSVTGGIMRVRDGLMRDWHDWFEEEGFIHVHTPILTSSDCEGAGETFMIADPINPTPATTTDINPSPAPTPISSQIASTSTSSSSTNSPNSPQTTPEPFFPKRVNLTVSSQLHLEGPTHALSRTYTLSPAFRAEPSVTSRHLSEFYMLEAEVAFLDRLDELLDLVEDGIKRTLRVMMDGAGKRHVRMRDDLGKISVGHQEDGDNERQTTGLRPDLLVAAKEPFARITYTKAIDLLIIQHRSTPFRHPPQWGQGLSTEQEKWLADEFGRPTFVTHYPRSLKPFYMLPTETDRDKEGEGGKETVECFDLLLPGLGELIGGSLREHRLPQLLSAIKKHNLKREDYEWYLDLRRFGTVPHGGWGMGWDRWVMWVTGVGNVRDVVAFPRWKGNCDY